MDVMELLRALPKAELHCHLEGAVPAATVIDLARKNGVSLPTQDPELLCAGIAVSEQDFAQEAERLPRWVFTALERKYQRPVRTTADLHTLGLYEEFLAGFDDICRSLVTADDFSRAAYESLVLAADASNVRYREMFFHPMNHPGVAYRTMLDGLLDGIRAAETDRGIVARLIPAINRDHSAAAAVAFVEEVLAHRVPEVVGLASDYDEEHLPAFAEAYRIAREAGLPGTAHAGEFGGPQTVAECIDVLGCRRIDHGYTIVADPALVARARELGVHFTAVFSASVHIHHADHWPLDPPALPPARRAPSPVREMLDAGLSLSLNSDDPAFDGFESLLTQYGWAAGHLGLDVGQLAELSLVAVDNSWQDDGARKAMRKAFEAEIAALAADAAALGA